ncbi:MAG: AbrB/MazE/SpoVT family DNA-binding domain-containing protein [Clostridia bacterium]|nr:AbrB/MazE/SpoVT family DNA-binding domain-containing protein [Clostridia bacterium]
MNFKQSCIRRIDSSGRIVIPKELREKSGLIIGASFTLSIEGDALILTPTERHCIICGQKAENVNSDGQAICQNCLSQFRPHQ